MSPAPTDIEAIVIGLGSAGEALAGSLADRGVRVVGFEPGLVGGECPFVACIPSKAMLHDAHRPPEARRSWAEAVKRRDELTSGRDDSSHHDELESRGVTVVRQRARLDGPRRVVDEDGRIWSAPKIVIATGSRPSVPPIEGIDDVEVWTSDDAMTTTELPASLVVLGAGAIGCELADLFDAYGTSVTVLEPADRPLGSLDHPVSDVLVRSFRERGIDVRTGAEATKVRATDTGVEVDLADGSCVAAERLLVAAGTTPNLERVGLESVGVETDDIAAGDRNPDDPVPGTDWLWAIGDANTSAPWTHGANYEAARLEARWFGERIPSTVALPHCVFTQPPVAQVGQSFEQAVEDGIDALRSEASFGDVARGSTDELAEGLLTVVVDRADGRIIGCSGVGASMDDIVATAAALIHTGACLPSASDLVFAFPTRAQVLEVALARAADQLRN